MNCFACELKHAETGEWLDEESDFDGTESLPIPPMPFFFTSWLPKEDSVRNWDDQGSYAAMICKHFRWLVFAQTCRIWWRYASLCGYAIRPRRAFSLPCSTYTK
jgi:hypothetical protein